MSSVDQVARLIAELQRDRQARRVSQLPHSTVADVPVPDALEQGVGAAEQVEFVDGVLDDARLGADDLADTHNDLADLQTGLDEALDEAGDILDESMDDLALALEDAQVELEESRTRLDDAAGRIDDAFNAADQAQQDAAAALAAAEAAIGANAIADPGLETPPMWTDRLTDAGPRFSIVSTGARSGVGALQVTEGAAEAVLTLGTMPVKVGMVLRFQAWVNTPSGLATSERPVIEYVDQAGAVVYSSTMSSFAASGAWAVWGSTLTLTDANASVTSVTARLRARHTAARTILFDDFELVDYTAVQELTTAFSGAIQAKPGVYYRTDAPGSSDYAALGSTWFQIDASGNVIAQFQQTAATIGNPPTVGREWAPVELDSEVIANLDVGKLRAGSAAINDVVAQRIASASGQFLELDVGQLVASDAVLDEAVANKIWSDSTVTRLLTAQDIVAGSAIVEGTITADKLAANALTVGILDVGSSVDANTPALTTTNWAVSKTTAVGGGNPTMPFEWLAGGGIRVRTLQWDADAVYLHQLSGGIEIGDNSAISVEFDTYTTQEGPNPFDFPPFSVYVSVYHAVLRNGVHRTTPYRLLSRTRLPMREFHRSLIAPLTVSDYQAGDKVVLKVLVHTLGATSDPGYNHWVVELRNLQAKLTSAPTLISRDSVKTDALSVRSAQLDNARADTLATNYATVSDSLNVLSGAELTFTQYSDDASQSGMVVIDYETAWRMKDASFDSGWVDLSGYLASGYSGTLTGRIVGSTVEIAGELSGSWSNGSSVTVTSTMPEQWRSPTRNRWGSAYGTSGYAGVAWMRPAGTIGVANRSGANWSTCQFSIVFTI